MQIAEHGKIVKTPIGWKVPSQSGNGSYVDNLDQGHPSVYELGLEPTFWTSDTKEAVVPKVLENYDF